jgi:hypothetical protein
MKNLQSLNALLPLGLAALGLWLALFRIVRSSVRAKKSSSSEGEQISALLQATRSTLQELKTMLSAEAACPGMAEASPIPEFSQRPALVERVEIELFQKVRQYQLQRLGKTLSQDEEGHSNFHSTPAIS